MLVKVTKLLGVKYLWLQDLCLIQDQSPAADWEVGTQIMLDYYRVASDTMGNLDGQPSCSRFLSLHPEKLIKILNASLPSPPIC